MTRPSQGDTRFIFVTGGVVSALGKGIAAASIGRLLVSRGFRVQLQKFDPYINVDPGTMSPFQHGEVFVTEDGAETDLDLGHYERFVDVALTRRSNATTGPILVGAWFTLRERAMLGDTGSNLIGAVAGVWLLTTLGEDGRSRRRRFPCREKTPLPR